MRIIAGTFRRTGLQAPDDLSTRPTTDRVRESIFNLLTARLGLDDVSVLDLFAGTGALGLEAMSRGAARVVFVEEQVRVLRYTKANAERLGVERACTFMRADAVAYLKHLPAHTRFDLIFADPPYELEALPDLPALALPRLTDGGLFVLEHSDAHSFDDHPHLDTSRKYGRTIVSVFSSTPTEAGDVDDDETEEDEA